MFDGTLGTDRRTVLQVLGVTGLLGTTGYTGVLQGEEERPDTTDDSKRDESEAFLGRVPAIDLPVIDAYYEGDVVWFLHTDVSDGGMANRLSEMIDYPTYHTPALAEVVDIDAAAPIYVFTNGIDRCDAEPWGGGPFGYQIDVLDSVPEDEEYTSVRNPRIVTWTDDAEPEVLKSVEGIQQAEADGRVKVKQTDVAVTAPVVSWSGGPDRPHLRRR